MPVIACTYTGPVHLTKMNFFDAETCPAAEINWESITVAKKEVWENKQINMIEIILMSK